jgi:hypothetical protein
MTKPTLKAMRPACIIRGFAAAAVAAGACASLLLVPTEASAKSIELSPGVVVDLATNRAYVMRPEGGIAALELAQGKTLWESKDAAKPLTIAGDLLVSQAEPEEDSNELKIVTLDTENEGRAVLEQSIQLPASVKPSITRSAARAFTASADVVTGDAAVTWQYQERFVQGKRAEKEVLPGEPEPPAGTLPPGVLRTEQGEAVEGGPKTETANGAFRLDLRSGTVTPQRPAQRSAPVAATGQAIELPPSEQLSGVPEPQFLSADGEYVMHPELVPGGNPGERYVWTIYSKATGQSVGTFKTQPRYAPFFVTGSILVYQFGPFAQKTAAGMVEEPVQLRAVDLNTGNLLWQEAIRDVVDRSAPRP